MNLNDLHTATLEDPAPDYHEWLAEVMNPEEYHAYHTANAGHKYYVYLAKLVRRLRPRKIVELGTDLGRSALFMLTQLPEDGHLYTVEIGKHVPRDLQRVKNNPQLHVFQGDDLDEGILAMLGGSQPIDLLFVDTNHEYDQVRREWMAYRHLLAPNGIAVFDDIHLNAGMSRFWEEVWDPKVDCGVDLHFSGFGLVMPGQT